VGERTNLWWALGLKGGRYDTPDSGTIIRSRSGFNGYGGVGGLTDPSGIIWSSNRLLRWNPDLAPGGVEYTTYEGSSYGLCIDSQGNVWNTAYSGDEIRKFNSDGVLIDTYQHGSWYARDCVVDKNDDVWVAHYMGNSVGHLKNDGTHVGNVIVGNGPGGVSVDRNGKIWSANYYDGTLSRIDPNGGDVGGGGFQIGEVDLNVTLPAGFEIYGFGKLYKMSS
jgi:streptogramin lyase